MSEQRRLFLFFVLSMASFFGVQFLLDWLGLSPRSRKAETPPVAAARDDLNEEQIAQVTAFAEDGSGITAFAAIDDEAAPALAAAPAAAPIPPADLVPPAELMLGAVDPNADPASAYKFRVALVQLGAGVERLELAFHESEPGRRGQPGERLALIDASVARGRKFGPPLGIEILLPGQGKGQEDVRDLSFVNWDVVRDDQGRAVRPLAADPAKNLLEGEEVVFRTALADVGLSVTKRIALRKGRDALDFDLQFEPSRPITFAYRIQGPYGIPVEGEWYTSVWRDVFFGKIAGPGATDIETRPANEVVEREAQGDPIRAISQPLKFAGVENQYFATFIEPAKLPASPDQRWDEKTTAIAIVPEREKHKSDVSLIIDSREIKLAAGLKLDHAYYLFAGPKSSELLEPFGAGDLANYRKGWQIPLIGGLATWLARTTIAPLLDRIYGVTKAVAGVFGGKHGNYGIAIILLTVAVRLLMFPLSRKQAQSAKRMQDLQPQLLALREKYKDDKEKIGRETLTLYQKNGVNPLGGCGLVLIQMPIFLGLWQALNNSVALRHANFLWIRNLAAPDQLMPFGTDVPFLGPYLNLLPFVTIALMLVQTKLFSPPATTPEQKQQQSMMKWMLVVMMMMFYRVPSGLGLYFIVSSMWSIGERLLLPKLAGAPKPSASSESGSDTPEAPSGKSAQASARVNATAPGNGRRPGLRERLREQLERVIEEASHDKTARNAPAADRARRDSPPGATKARRPKPPGKR